MLLIVAFWCAGSPPVVAPDAIEALTPGEGFDVVRIEPAVGIEKRQAGRHFVVGWRKN